QGEKAGEPRASSASPDHSSHFALGQPGAPHRQGAQPGQAVRLPFRLTTRVGESVLSALGTSTCARMSIRPPYSRSARTPSPRNRGRAILSDGRVCLGSALHWWLRLQGVFPVCNPDPGSVLGPITGDPDPVTPCQDRVVPVRNTDW